MAEPKFEKDLAELEKVIEALEEGELPLDEALKKFEQGIKLAQRCDKALTEAEKKIEILVKNADGELEAQPFGDEPGEVANNCTPEPPEPEDEPEDTLF